MESGSDVHRGLAMGEGASEHTRSGSEKRVASRVHQGAEEDGRSKRGPMPNRRPPVRVERREATRRPAGHADSHTSPAAKKPSGPSRAQPTREEGREPRTRRERDGNEPLRPAVFSAGHAPNKDPDARMLLAPFFMRTRVRGTRYHGESRHGSPWDPIALRAFSPARSRSSRSDSESATCQRSRLLAPPPCPEGRPRNPLELRLPSPPRTRPR
jgi:hypothetical protein